MRQSEVDQIVATTPGTIDDDEGDHTGPSIAAARRVYRSLPGKDNTEWLALWKRLPCAG